MSDASVPGWRSAAMAGVMTIGVLAIGAAAIYGGAVGAGRYLDARAISEMRPSVARLMVQDTVNTVIGAESAYMAGLMGAHAEATGPVSREFRSLQDRFERAAGAPEYRTAGAERQAESPLTEAQLIELARAVIDRHEGLRDLLETARSRLSGAGLDREGERDLAALLIMDRLVGDGSLGVAPAIADRIRELTAGALADPELAARAGPVRDLVGERLPAHLALSPSAAAEAGNLINGAPGVDRLEIRSTMGQKHAVSLGPAGTYRNVAHVEVRDPFAEGARIRLDGEPAPDP